MQMSALEVGVSFHCYNNWSLSYSLFELYSGFFTVIKLVVLCLCCLFEVFLHHTWFHRPTHYVKCWIAANSTYSLNLLFNVIPVCYLVHKRHFIQTTLASYMISKIYVVFKWSSQTCTVLTPMVSIVLFLGIFIESSTQQTGWVVEKAIEEKIPCWGRPSTVEMCYPPICWRVVATITWIQCGEGGSNFNIKQPEHTSAFGLFFLDSFTDSKKPGRKE